MTLLLGQAQAFGARLAEHAGAAFAEIACRKKSIVKSGGQMEDMLAIRLKPAIYHPCEWFVDGLMNVLKLLDSEKLTLNIGFVDLGKIDLLVREGFYSNRSDFIRTAIRNQLAAQSSELERVLVRHTFDVGLRAFGKDELERIRRDGRDSLIRVLGLARIEGDVSGELAQATIESITVLGALQASDEVKRALAGRIH